MSAELAQGTLFDCSIHVVLRSKGMVLTARRAAGTRQWSWRAPPTAAALCRAGLWRSLTAPARLPARASLTGDLLIAWWKGRAGHALPWRALLTAFTGGRWWCPLQMRLRTGLRKVSPFCGGRPVLSEREICRICCSNHQLAPDRKCCIMRCLYCGKAVLGVISGFAG